MVGEHMARGVEASMVSDARAAAVAIHGLYFDAGHTFANLSVSGEAGTNATWTIDGHQVVSPLSDGNTAGVVTGSVTATTFQIYVTNENARDARQWVSINHDGDIDWHSTAPSAPAGGS
ncbi:hypothetical protein M1M97_03730 [Thermodesulfovibrionales bacterium]|nr:hypothetical protein [Thermodesulfovibrionales bacterium]